MEKTKVYFSHFSDLFKDTYGISKLWIIFHNLVVKIQTCETSTTQKSLKKKINTVEIIDTTHTHVFCKIRVEWFLYMLQAVFLMQ